MALPSDYRRWTTRLNRFASKDATEAESFFWPMEEANIQMTGNYSVATCSFYLKPPKNYLYEIYRVCILVRDNIPMNSEKYISSGPLTNGILVLAGSDNSPFVGKVTEIPIKRISDFASYVGVDVTPMDYVNNPNSFAVRWTFTKGGGPLWLNGDDGDRVEIILNDNFSSLIGHTALYQGVIHKIDDTYQEGKKHGGF